MPDQTHSQEQLTQADIDRFWSKVDKSGGTDACWLWRAGTFKEGYGCFSVTVAGKDSKWHANRLSYALAKPGVPLPECVCHECDNPPCVNPAHLFPGTRTINNLDCKNKGRLKPPRQHHGEKNTNAKLSNADVAEIVRLVHSGKKYHEIAPIFGTTKSNISQIVNGKRRTAV